MSDHGHDSGQGQGQGHGHGAPADGKTYWLDNPKNVNLIWYGLIAICVGLFAADFFVEKHPHFDIEKLPNFYGFYGFIGCVFLVLAAAQLRKVLMRDEDYYERRDAALEPAAPPSDHHHDDHHHHEEGR